MVKISPSILACDFSRLADEVGEIERAGAEYVHLDVMDGIFVPNISFGFPVIAALRPLSSMVFDVHLMIAEPMRYLDEVVKAGADIITVHQEACPDIVSFAKAVHARGKRAAVSVKPKTPIEVLYPYLEHLDMVLIMTVEPGYGGQKLIPETVEKVRALRARCAEKGLPLEIEVDGGVNEANAAELISAGADVLVAGSAVFHADDKRLAIDRLRTSV